MLSMVDLSSQPRLSLAVPVRLTAMADGRKNLILTPLTAFRARAVSFLVPHDFVWIPRMVSRRSRGSALAV